MYREQQLAALRDGRRNRAARFKSKKDYRRKPKHTKTTRKHTTITYG